MQFNVIPKTSLGVDEVFHVMHSYPGHYIYIYKLEMSKLANGAKTDCSTGVSKGRLH
jgi:hypothetical protein